MTMRKINLLMERANNYEMSGEYNGQEIAAVEALELSKKVAESDRSQPIYLVNLAIAHDKMGAALANKGDTAGARAQFLGSLKALASLPVDKPAWLEHKTRFSCVAHYRLGTVLPKEGLPREEMEQNLSQAEAACDAWVALAPADGQRKAAAENTITQMRQAMPKP
jgi:hypothetical protein